MSDNIKSYQIEWDNSDIKGAIRSGFSYMEMKDEIVGTIFLTPSVAKRVVLALPEEVTFDYIPEGIGRYRTAYLKYRPNLRDTEIRFMNQHETIELRMSLI